MTDRTYKKGWRAHTDFTVSTLIRRYLLENGKAYVQELYRVVKREFGKSDIKYWGTRDSFGTYIRNLVRLSLLEFVGEGEAPFKGAAHRHYYDVVQENVKSEAWDRPMEILHPEKKYGSARYETKKAEAEMLGITVRELALDEYPEIRRLREELEIDN